MKNQHMTSTGQPPVTHGRSYSVCLFAESKDDNRITGHPYKSTFKALDTLRFVPVSPIKKGILQRKVDPMEMIGTPLFFNMQEVTKKCIKHYYFDGSLRCLLRRRLHSPIICAPSDLWFPFSHKLIARTATTKSIADRVSDEDIFDDFAGSSSGEMVDEDFFGSGGAS